MDSPGDNSMAIRQFVSPDNCISRGDVSTLMIHGLSDWFVSADSNITFYTRRVVADIASVFVGLPNQGLVATFCDIRTIKIL